MTHSKRNVDTETFYVVWVVKASKLGKLFWGLLISLNGSIKLSTPIKEVVKI